MSIFALLASLALAFLLFWAGARFGERHAARDVAALHRDLKLVLHGRNLFKSRLDQAMRNAQRMELNVKQIFPWLCSILLALVGFGAHAQVPAPVTYYSPDNNLEMWDTNAIAKAQTSIDLAAFSLTDQVLIETLAARARAGVKVRIYLDRGELQAECRGDITCARIPLHELIGMPQVDIRVKFSKILMHLKSYAVDKWLVRGGSANFSSQGERSQDNSATFSTDREAVGAFESKFEAMWSRSGNLTVAQAVVEGEKR